MLGVDTVNALIGGVNGLKPGSTAAATRNVDKIQNTLDTQGIVLITVPGTYYLNNTLYMPDNSLLAGVPGVLLQQVSGTNKLMLTNYAAIAPSVATVTVAWTAGVIATVTWTNHGKTAGDAFFLQGASPMVYNNVFRVLEVLTANTFTIRLPESPNAAATGTVLAYDCNRNFHVRDIALDYGYTTNGAISDMRRHAINFIGMADCTFRNIKSQNVDKYGFCTSADLDCRYENIQGYNVAEIFKHYGPSLGHKASGIYGIARDDATTIQAKEPAAFAGYQPYSGNIYRLKVDTVDVMQANGTASSAVCIYASDNETMEDVTVEDVLSHADDGNGCQIKYGDTFSTGTLGTVTLRNINSSTATVSTKYAMIIAASVRSLLIDCPAPKNQDAASPTQLLRVDTLAIIKSLVINRPYFNNASWATAAAAYFINLTGSAIESTLIVEPQMSGNTTGTRFLTIGTGAIGPVTIMGGSFENMSMVGIVQAGASATRVINMIGVKCKTVVSGWDVRSLTKFNLTGCYFDTMTSGVIRPTTTAGLMAQVHGSGNINISAAMVAAAAPATFEAYSEDISLDPLTATGLATTNGQFFISTNAGANMAGYARRTNGQWVAIGTGAAGANTIIV